MQDLKLSLIQTFITPNDPELNLSGYEPLLRQARGSDLVVLPEVFTTGFSASARDHAEVVDGRAYEWMARWARELNAVVTGSLVVRHDDQYSNRLIWMRPSVRPVRQTSPVSDGGRA